MKLPSIQWLTKTLMQGIAWECEQLCGEKCFMSSYCGERETIGIARLQILILKSI